MDIKELINQENASIVDVRSQQEFMSGHVSGSINIPLQEIPNQVNKLKEMSKPLILCCASGNRSGQAVNFLNSNGVECYNGGGWMQVNGLKNQATV